MSAMLDRKDFLRASGALVVGFGMSTAVASAQSTPSADQVDSWLSIAPDGNVTIFIGKVELGTGIETSFAQFAAEELSLWIMGQPVIRDLGQQVELFSLGAHLDRAAFFALSTPPQMIQAHVRYNAIDPGGNGTLEPETIQLPIDL